MHRSAPFLVYILFCVNCFSQQYPFVHYTPKDGLISNQVKNIYQDSRGRLYFSTFNGLSVYDGSRFSNYNTKNGLPYDIVNCTIEMGDDSIWIVTNTTGISCLVKGKLKPLVLEDNIPVINNLTKDENGKIYAAAEQGLYFFDKNRFVKLPFSDRKGKDVNFYLTNLAITGDYILIQRDFGLLREKSSTIYLYNRVTKKVSDELDNIISFSKSPDGRIWISTPQKIMAIDNDKLTTGKLVLKELPEKFSEIKQLGNFFVSFDNESTCWLGNQNNILIKASADGEVFTFTKASGLDFLFISHIYTDKEGTVWMATDNAGIYKLIRNNFSMMENFFGMTTINSIFFSKEKKHLLLFSSKMNKLLIINNNSVIEDLNIRNGNAIEQIFETPNGIYAVGNNFIYKMHRNNKTLQPKIIYTDTTDQAYSGSLVDKNGILFVCGRSKMIGIIKKQNAQLPGKDIIYEKRLNDFADHLASDSKGNIWVVTRSNELLMYKTHPEDPANYLEEKINLKNIYPGISPRSITIDKDDNIWIGTRYHGIHVLKLKEDSIIHLAGISDENGLSDKFITQLVCDADNDIWAASPSGLDKITWRNNKTIVENQTKQNNIYQRVFKIVADDGDNVWGLLSNGLLKITKDKKKQYDYSPPLIISLVKAGKDTISNTEEAVLPYRQNSLSFYFAALSFLNEKQISYSYRLLSGNNDQWSDPSNSTSVSLIDLRPGKYVLEIKAVFPAGRYPEQITHYKFSITPPWWQTWWFRSGMMLLGIGFMVLIFRFYYNKRLEKQKATFEKQQAIEKERTRIATDMHDDLGAGLSRIKYLSQSLLTKKKDEIIKPELEKITAFSDEMSEKMGEIIWALNEKNDTIADLIAYTRSYAVEYLASHNIHCEASTPSNLPETFITGEMRRNIFLSVKECLHNVVKHAGATKVSFSINLDPDMLIIIHDNGKGIDRNNQRAFSNGIQNIEKRMSEINGRVRFTNERGTKVSLTIPVSV